MRLASASAMLRLHGPLYVEDGAPENTMHVLAPGFVAWARVDERPDCDAKPGMYRVDWPALVLAGEVSAEQSDDLSALASSFPHSLSLRATWRESQSPILEVERKASARRRGLALVLGAAPALPSLDFGPATWSVDLRVLVRALELFGRVLVYRCASREARHLVVLASDEGPPRESHLGAVVAGA